MKKSNPAFLILSILFCCFFSGCAGLLKNERMDQEVEHLIAALNENDADRIFKSMYPGVITQEEFDEGYGAVQQLWEKSDNYTIKLNSFNTKKTLSNSGDSLIHQAQYYVYTQENSYTITLAYLSDDNGFGLYQFDLTAGAEPVLLSGSFSTARENSVFQWCLLLLRILSYLFIIATAVDILRKRPRLFGLWLVASLVFVCFQAQISPNNFQIGGGVNLLGMSAFKIYSSGTRNLVLALPGGTIAYWCLRQKLLAQKKQ